MNVTQAPQQNPNVHYFTIDNTLVYVNFYADFGPSNLSHVYRFCDIMVDKLQNPALRNKKICLYSAMDKAKRANSAYLISAFMMLVLKHTPEESYAPLQNVEPPFVDYRDAGYGPATYFLSILDCLRGLYRGIELGLFHVDKHDLQEYEFYEKVENGDLNWITNKFIALASPKDDPQEQQGFAAYLLGNQGRAPTPVQKTSHGKNVFSAYRKDDLIKFLKDRGVGTIVRLNNNVYERNDFIEAGIEHVELYFPDGSTPPDGILKRFLELCESRTGPIAVHCKAGLGRTGSLIGAYLMKHYRLTASETISLMRVIRPGSVVGPQQNWLESMQNKLWKMTPSVKLRSSISLLEPSTFENSKRFETPYIRELIIEINEEKKRLHASQEDIEMDQSEDSNEEMEDIQEPQYDANFNDSYNKGNNKQQRSKISQNTLAKQKNKHQKIPSNIPGNFHLDEFVIPVQPRKGRKGESPEEELYQNGKNQQKFNDSKEEQVNDRYQMYASAASSAQQRQNPNELNMQLLKGAVKSVPSSAVPRNTSSGKTGY
ncbi:Dual specificity protein phosphatase cdc14a [Clydaea vesicula]|uniref:protein-tyrosine-phosphatase n=1 Tax=Clydaea vesicula TaxID=447962 RepID=A0AAD5XXU5_9FUNG|nr:Dual specificity protein phosphatase cdc14a [Clydaea vesicula]